MSYEIYNSQESHQPQTVGNLLGSLNSNLIKQALSSKSAYALWLSATGVKERNHTMGVYLAEPDNPSNKSNLRTLTVYVDSNTIMQDFRTNAELYLLKLKRVGMLVDGIEFRLSKKNSKKINNVSLDEFKDNPLKVEYPTRSEEQIGTFEDQLKKVENEKLRDSLRRAIGLDES